MGWTVTASRRAEKEVRALPETFRLTLRALIAELRDKGPYRANWAHYSPLRGQKNHYRCHLQGWRPTYVACWRVDKKAQTIEVYYAGTHEKAPY